VSMPLADLTVRHEGARVVAVVDGEVDLSNAAELGQAIGRGVPSDALGVALDLSGAQYLDSAGIAIIFELHERLSARRQRLCLVVPSGSPVAESLRVTGVLGAIRTAETRADALRELALEDRSQV
jgi:anti-anti-sigma factor